MRRLSTFAGDMNGQPNSSDRRFSETVPLPKFNAPDWDRTPSIRPKDCAEFREYGISDGDLEMQRPEPTRARAMS